MGLLDILNRHAKAENDYDEKKKKEQQDQESYSSLSNILQRHAEAAEDQASYGWQTRRKNVGMDPGTHPVLMQAAAEKAAEESRRQVERFGLVSSLPSSQAYYGRYYLTNPSAAYLDYREQQREKEEEQKKHQVPYNYSSPLTNTMLPWMYKLSPSYQEDKGTKITNVTDPMSVYLSNASEEYAQSGQPIVSAENVERIAKLQNEISDLEKERDNLPVKHATGPRGAVVTTDTNKARRDQVDKEIAMRQQAIEMLRNESPASGTSLTSTSYPAANRLMRAENQRIEEETRKREEAEAEKARIQRLDEEAKAKKEREKEEDEWLATVYENGGLTTLDEEGRKKAVQIIERNREDEAAEKRRERHANDPTYMFRLAQTPSWLIATQPEDVQAEYIGAKAVTNPAFQHNSKIIANISTARASLDKNKAWSAYMHNPTEFNKKYAESMTRAYERHAEADKDIINRDDDIGNLVTEHLASYLPQAYDQFRYQLPGAVFGALIGGGTGMKAGRVIGNTVYSYETMSGAAFENLVKQGVPEDVARQAAMDEAILSTIIEDMDLIIDMFTTGFGKTTSSLFGTSVGGLDKAIANWVGDSTVRKWAVRLGKYGLNILSEANEEGSQESVSIANENLMKQGRNISLTELALTALNVYIDGLFSEDSENRDRILEAAKGGAALALVNMPMESAGNAMLYGGTTMSEGRRIRTNNMINETVDAGLYSDSNSRAYKLAQQIQEGQNRTGGNRLQEIARQMQQDYRLGQLATENRYNESAMSEAETLVRGLAQKSGTGERITNSEVASILGNDLAVMELEQASGREISSINTSSERVEAVREALSVASENYRAASQLDQAEQSNIFSTTNRSLANGANSGSEGTLNTANATYIASQTPTGQRITGEFSTPALNEISASMTKRFAEERSRVLETRAREMQEDARARSVAAMNDRIDRAAQASVNEWEQRIETLSQSPNFDLNPQLDNIGHDMLMREDGSGIGGYMTFVADWIPGQDVSRYTQDWIRYYNAGYNGQLITEVGDISSQIITQEQRENAYIAGQWDGRESTVKEISNEYHEQNTDTGTADIVGATSIDRRSERITPPRAGVEGRRSSVWAEEAERRRNLQAKRADDARAAAAAEGLKAQTPSQLGLKNVSEKSRITEIPEGSAAYTEGMKRQADRAKRFGVEMHYYIGDMRSSDGTGSLRGYNDDRVIWVQVDHEYQDAETIAEHELFHTIRRYYPRVVDAVKRQIIKDHSEESLRNFMATYADAYSMRGMSEAEILEEIFADAFAGLDDFFEVQSAGYEGATRFTDATRMATQEYADRVQEDVAEGLNEQEVREREGNQELAEEDQAEEGVKASRNIPKKIAEKYHRFFEELNAWKNEKEAAAEIEDEDLRAKTVEDLGRRDIYVGTTSEVLQSLGAIESDVFIRGSAINALLKDHAGMTFDEVEAIPEIIENPVAILKSKSKDPVLGSPEGTKRIVIFGNHKVVEQTTEQTTDQTKENGIPTLVVMDLRPNSKKSKSIIYTDVQEVVKSYFRKKGRANFLEKSDWLYVDKNRATKLIRSMGIQYPTTLIKSGSVGTITYKDRNVNRSGNFSDVSENLEVEIKGVPFNEVFSRLENTETEGIKLSRNAVNDINEITRKVENGEGLTSSEEVRFSLNHDADFVEKERAFKQSFVSSDVLTESFAQREFVRNKLMQPGIRELLPEDKMGKTSFGNGSYGRSMEHSTICPRTLSMEAILDGLSEKFGRPITVDESIKISQLAWAYMDAPECAYCYVAMDRKAKREYLLNYMTSRNEVFKNIDSGMSREDAYNVFLNGRKDTKPMKDRFNNWIRMRENGSEMIEMKDLTSDRAIKAASAKSKSMADQVKDALKYAQSASWAKKYVQYTAYNGEILKWNQKLVNSLNRMYGMRMYSFSDFHPAFTLEDMQMITDASLRGLKVLAYTKELDFARIMEPTGANINISVFAQNTKDVNGNYGMDAMQGADWEEAKALRAKSIKNGTGIGITMVCTNDDQVEWALGQEWIDVVIPFHMVKTGAKVAEHFGWTNYTDMQGDRKLKDLWDGKANEAMIEPPEHQNNKQLYLEALERNNLSPRFENWVDNPNYMKLVNETRRAEGETPTVQPKFNLDAADAMFDKMQKQGGYYQHLGLETDVFEDLQDEIYDEYVEKYGSPAKFSRNRRVSEDAQKTITGQQMDLEQKLMQTAELLKAAEKENKKLQAQLTEAQRNMRITKEKTALESSVQRAADKLLKNYDVFPDDKRSYNEIKYEVASTLEKMRNKVLNITDPEEIEKELRHTAIGVTERIISGMQRLKSADLDSYQQIKTYLRAKPGITISEKDRSSMRDYNAFRKRNMGRINLTNHGIPVDTAYKEMQELYGLGYFPDDITHPADQLYRIEEVVQSLKPVYENYNSYEIAEIKEYLASELENEVLDIVMGDAIKSVPSETTDKIAAQYTGDFSDRLVEMRKKNLETVLRIVDREREYRTNTEKKYREHYQKLDIARREKRDDSDARTRLLKIAQRLKNKKLPTPNKELIQQYIGTLDVVSKSITRTKLDKLIDLKSWYDNQKETNPDFESNTQIEADLRRLSQRRIDELSIDEVRDLTRVLLNIENEVKNEKYLIDSEDRRQLQILREETIKNINNTKGIKAGSKIQWLDERFVNGTLSPVRAMRRMTGYVDSDPMYQATVALADGQRKMFDYQMRANQLFTKWTEDKAFIREIMGKHAKEIEIAKGVKITPAMRMSLYLHVKNDSNLRHISHGGLVIPDMKLYKQGKIQDAYSAKKMITLKKSQIEEIVKGMTEKEKAFADAISEYMNGMSQEAINETSELLQGYPAAEVKNYFPIETDPNFTVKEFDSIKMDGTIEGMGFLKERIEASNPIYLRDINDVLTKSIDSTSKYVGLAIPVRNMNKLLRGSLRNTDADGKWIDGFKGSVRDSLENKWGKSGLNYVANMMTDIQNMRKSAEGWSKTMQKLRSHYARAVLTLNASVAMKQAASYPTAGAVLGWKPLVRALADVGKVDAEKINQYTPLLWYRTQGFSTQELGDMKQRGMQLPKVLNWVQGMDVLTTRKLWKASEYYIRDQRKDLKVGSDEYYKAVAEIYNRVIEETQPNYTTMQRPQLLRQDDTLLSSLMMFKTQPFQNFNIVYDAIGNWMAKEQQYKLNQNETTEAAVKAARRDAANAITSQVAQLAVFAGMTFAWAMFRGKADKYKDEDGEITFGSALKGIGKDMLGNAFSGIPFGSDAWEFISSQIFGDKYYGFDVAVASSIEDMFNSFTKAFSAIGEVFSTITDKDKSLADINWNDQRMNLKSVVYAVAKIAGVPVENVEKFVGATFRHVAKAAAGTYEGEYAYLRLTTSENKYASDYYDLLWRAYKNDPEAYKKLYDQMVNLDGLNADKIKTAMEKKMKAEEGVSHVDELSQQYMNPYEEEMYSAYKSGSDEEYEAAFNKLVDELGMTENQAIGVIEDQLKAEQGVKSVNDLEERPLSPEKKKQYNQYMDIFEKKGFIDRASDKVDAKMKGWAYNLADESKTGLDMKEKMDKYEQAGIDNATYILYQAALAIADDENDGNGHYTNPETEAAIRMLELTDEQSSELWILDGKSEKSNPWKK